ncbi:Golgi integral membrane protein 4-like isoform X2 [Phlebotomus argentipes]|uniref:Golgi integral membrane protein 4-like isoform X2 n=1 Tax=Phlebotomus argentipes TaxID=94469 RepID=UPI002893834B|nr:Golgi integral membrane protein 4-like isoform X2 [Phlebotomus argentipes]
MIMTTSRLARAGRSRFFIGIGILLLMVGFVAIFHSSQQQLDELRQMGRRCEQQHEAISSQLQTEVEKNFRLEKSLEGERLSHQQNRVELQQKAREEKEIREKSTKESNSRLASLQQHYKLLQSQHDDLQESCSKSHQKQLEEINGLQRKLENLRQGEKQKDKEIEHWKVKYKALEIEKINLEGAFKAKGGSLSDSLKVAHLERVVEQFEAHCAFRPDTLEHHVSNSPSSGRVHPDNEKNFNAQLTMIPRPNDKGINSANVLQEPPSAQVAVKSSTATLDRRQSPLSQGNALPIAVIPTVLSSTKKTPDVLHKTKSRAVPQGVVPVPESMKELLKEEETQNAEMSPRSPDRYSNAMVDSVQQAPKKEDTRPEGEANFQNVNEVDNGAHEVDDFNIVEDKNHRDHLQDVLDDEKLNVNANNAAEEDTNLYDTNKIPLNRQKPNDDIDLEIINRRNPHLEANGEKHKYANDKLMNEEVAADQGFDLAAEEQVEEGDDDEYSNLAALHQQGQVVRN